MSRYLYKLETVYTNFFSPDFAIRFVSCTWTIIFQQKARMNGSNSLIFGYSNSTGNAHLLAEVLKRGIWCVYEERLDRLMRFHRLHGYFAQ